MNTATLDRPAIEPTTALTLPQRAAVALGESANAAKLRELVTKSAGILTVTNPDGRDEAHRAGMVLIKTRTNIEKTGKAAREDATAFSKAVIAMEKDLIAIIEPEETRVLKLRDAFDEQIAAEKAAKIAAERALMAAIETRISVIRDVPLHCATSSSEGIAGMMTTLSDMDLTVELFGDRFNDAVELRVATLATLQGMVDKAKASEAAAHEAEQARIAEAARLESERAAIAAQSAENERIANEQAAERQRLADLAAAQELAAKQLRDKAAANLQAEHDAMTERLRIERERVATEQAKARAELMAQQEKLYADEVAYTAKVQRDMVDHAEALEMNAMFDAAKVACAKFPEVLAEQKAEEDAINADRARCTETANAMLTNGRSQVMSLEELAASIGDGDPDITPADIEIIDVYVENFGGTRAQAVARLLAFVGNVADVEVA